MKKLLLIALFISNYSFVFACELQSTESILIGCTEECDSDYKNRLRDEAKRSNYKLDFIDLSKNNDVKKALSSVDAVLIPGGADIDPKYYLENVTDELKQYTLANLNLVDFSSEGRRRDPFEYALLRTYISDSNYKDLPLLGVCRGMQMMTVAKGIPLYLDIKTELGIRNRRNLSDWISVALPDSLMAKLYTDGQEFKGYKYHHQGIRVDYYLDHIDEYPSVKMSAVSNKGLIGEALEYTDRKALGIQYHPELSAVSTSAPIYKWYLKNACDYKKMRNKR